MKLYRNLITKKVKPLTVHQYRRLFPVKHNGKIYEKAAWVEIDEPKKEASKEIIKDAVSKIKQSKKVSK